MQYSYSLSRTRIGNLTEEEPFVYKKQSSTESLVPIFVENIIY